MAVGNMVARDIDEVFAEWADCIHERKGSALHRLPNLLAKQPVVNASFVATELGISTRTAATIIERACEMGMLSPMGNRRRGVFYQCDELIAVLEDVSSMQGIRRILAGK